VELFIQHCVPAVGHLHVLVDLIKSVTIERTRVRNTIIKDTPFAVDESERERVLFSYLGDRNVKVGVETEDCTGDQDDKDGKRSILKIGQLNLHGSELDTPTDRARLGWRGLEPHGLPVGALKVLKVVRGLVVVHIQEFMEDDQWVADKEMGNVARQQIVDAIVGQLLVNVFIVNQGYIVVLGFEVGVSGNIRIDRVVARLGDPELVILQGLSKDGQMFAKDVR